MPKLRTLDLCSGVGGFSHALRDVAVPVAYCENDSNCRSVLAANMRARLLPAAPIFNDMTTLGGADLLRKGIRPQLITAAAGSSCRTEGQGCSSSHTEGQLISHIPRIVHEMHGCIKHVLLEDTRHTDPMDPMEHTEHTNRPMTTAMVQMLKALKREGLVHVSFGSVVAATPSHPHPPMPMRMGMGMRRRQVCLASSDPHQLSARMQAKGPLRSVANQGRPALVTADFVPPVCVTHAVGAMAKALAAALHILHLCAMCSVGSAPAAPASPVADIV